MSDIWQALKIDGKEGFFKYTFPDSESINFLFFDEFITFGEKLSREEVLNRAKLLNKRIQFDYETICLTLRENVPVHAYWEHSSDRTMPSKVLFLKYKIISYPFNYKWILKENSKEEFKDIIVDPLFEALNNTHEQNLELLEIVKKKDLEINQFKMEGASLRRTTLSTKPFDADEFEKKYSNGNMIMSSLQNITEKRASLLTNNSNESCKKQKISEASISPKNSETLTIRNILTRAKEVQDQRTASLPQGKLLYSDSPFGSQKDSQDISTINPELEYNINCDTLHNDESEKLMGNNLNSNVEPIKEPQQQVNESKNKIVLKKLAVKVNNVKFSPHFKTQPLNVNTKVVTNKAHGASVSDETIESEKITTTNPPKNNSNNKNDSSTCERRRTSKRISKYTADNDTHSGSEEKTQNNIEKARKLGKGKDDKDNEVIQLNNSTKSICKTQSELVFDSLMNDKDDNLAIVYSKNYMNNNKRTSNTSNNVKSSNQLLGDLSLKKLKSADYSDDDDYKDLRLVYESDDST